MTTSQLNELAAMKAALKQHIDEAEKATPGPWENADNVVFSDAIEGYYLVTCDGPKTTISQDPHNAAFIARARTMSPMACRIALEGIMSLEFIARTDCSCETYNIAEKRLLNIMYLWKGGQL